MKLLHLNDHYEQVGGAEVILFRTLEGLASQGVKNVVVHQHPAGLNRDYPHHCIPGLGEATLRRVPSVTQAFRRVVEEEEPDLIHIHDIGNPAIVELSCRLKPTLQSVLNHSFYCPGGEKYLPVLGKTCHRAFGPGCLASAFLTHCNSIRPRILFSSYHRSKRMLRNMGNLPFVTLSRYQADRLIESGIAPDRIRVLHPCTRLPDLSTELSPSSAEPTILFTGRIYPTKGLLSLIQALRYVAAPFRLIVDGDGPDLQAAQTLVRKLGLSARVEFTGWAPPEKHATYYRQCSLVAVPSLWPEPFGLVGIEAMSYGKPVVAFRVGGIPEWLEDNVTGFLVEPADLDGFSEKIEFLLRNPKIAKEMGARGRARVESEFTKDPYVSKLMGIYTWTIQGWKNP